MRKLSRQWEVHQNSFQGPKEGQQEKPATMHPSQLVISCHLIPRGGMISLPVVTWGVAAARAWGFPAAGLGFPFGREAGVGCQQHCKTGLAGSDVVSPGAFSPGVKQTELIPCRVGEKQGIEDAIILGGL